MELLLSKHPNIEITELVVTAAARNSMRGKEMMELLLSKHPNIEITEPVVTAAAGNWQSGKEVMGLLLSKHPNIEITEPVVTAAAGNRQSGKEVMGLLLSKNPDIEITELVVTAAAGNSRRGNDVMELLLARDVVLVSNPASLMAATYFGRHGWANILLTKCNITISDELCVQLICAAVESGVSDTLKTLFDLGGDYSTPDTHSWTAYMIAVQSRNTLALKQLPDTAPSCFSQTICPTGWEIRSCDVYTTTPLREDGNDLFYSGNICAHLCH